MTSMEEPWTDWLCDMEQDDYSFFNQSGINVGDIGSLASQHDIAAALQEENPQRLSFSTENTSTMSNSSVGTESSLERPSKLLKTQHFSQKKASSPSSGSYILSFDNAINPPPIKAEPALKPETKVVNSKNIAQKSNCKKTESLSRSTYHTPDHIIAERMRREKISQQFIALSALIPNLKKMDKASVLGDAIKYVKELKEQVKVKEEEQSKRKNMESVVLVNKSQPDQLSADEDDTSSNSCNNNGNSSDDISKKNLSLPEVEARMSGKNVLVRVLCEKEKAVLVNIFTEIEKLHLSVISCSSLSFGSSVVAITIMAEKMEDDEFNMGVEKLANNIRVGLLQLM